ncbi:MAG: GAF domain-containing sensor histidine kinase [bacterium]|nr:GAF domain-containing sensor histidine kinase [bacterium]
MKQKKWTISEKITLLNKTILDSMTEKDKSAIVKNFTTTSIKILGANFGFAWWKFGDQNKFKLAYKSPNTPYNPTLPREKAGNYIALKTKKPFFDNNIKKESYEFDIGRYLKTYIIIPIHYNENVYGNLVLCYKKRHNFAEEELTLAQAIGHATAQAITIHRLIKTDALLREERLKTEFIANATHELRTPLAIMKGNVDLALMDKENLKTAQETLRDVNAEINILSDILKDLALLTFSGKNAGPIVNPAPVNLEDLLDNLVKRLKIAAGEKNIEIKINKKKVENLLVAGNERYLGRLFVNLIQNAIHYGRNNGNIVIDLSLEKSAVKIKVADDGIGISKEDLPRIFERFYRGDKAHTHGSFENHSGLGLATARWAAEIHGGTIQAESVLGKSSTFTVTLPRLK